DIIVAGYVEKNDKTDAFVARLDRDGNVKWQKTYGGSGWDEVNAVALAPNGDIIVAGYTRSFGAGGRDAWVLRLDSEGNVKWQKTYGGKYWDEAHAVALAPNGDIIVAGYTESFGAGWNDVWVLRLDSEGNVKWQKTYGGSKWDEANAVALASNGDVIVAGYTGSFGAGGDVWVLRLDGEGNVKWQKTYGGSKWDEANAVAIADNGDIIVAGHYNGYYNEHTRISNAWVLRLDSEGNVKWQKTYGGEYGDEANAVAIAPNGDVIVAGYTDSFGAGGDDVWVLRLDANGNVKWQKTYGGSDNDEANAVALASNGDIIVAGYTESFATKRSIWVLRLPPDGNLPGCNFCGDSSAQVSDSDAYVDDTRCEVLSGIRKYEVEVEEGRIFKKKRTEWRTERVSVKVMDSRALVESLSVTPKVQYYLELESLMQNLQSSFSFSLPPLIEGADSILKFTVTNDFTDSLKATLDLSGNEFFELETTTLEFPELKRGQKVSKSLAVTPKYAGKFDFRIRIKAIVNGLEIEAEKVIPVEVAERTATPAYATPQTPVTPVTSMGQMTGMPFFNPVEALQEFYDDFQYIGEGGFARVFKAKRKRDGKVVAVKVPKTLDPATGKAFVREISNWLHLKHPNIVELYDVNVIPIPYLEMEYCEGSLARLGKPMDVERASQIVFNIAEGLKYAHAKRIIHRDLKPSNILLKSGIPKISDWGLSKVMSESRSSTLSSFTPYYASPEQLSPRRFGGTDERTDIWQLGVLFYELVTGKLPFEGRDLGEVTYAIINEEPVPPGQLNPEAKAVEPIIMKMLAKRKEERYASVAELQRDLAEILNMTYVEGLRKSTDLKRTVFYIGDLALINLKAGNTAEALKYLLELRDYAGRYGRDLDNLIEQVKLAVEEGVKLGEEAVVKADVIVHQIKMGR
ncbi:protein kinase, partial [Thermococcus sp.]|uniref:protein kinase domain-containing protein n=1 Tax=Thermococcus sp. TaxID=35749 RepID=UPI002608E346